MNETKKMQFEDVFTTITAYDGDMYRFCDYLSEKLGIKVEFGESPNDTDYNIELTKDPSVNGLDDLDEYDRETVQDFLDNGYLNMYYGYSIVLEYLCNVGTIPPGNYSLRVCW